MPKKMKAVLLPTSLVAQVEKRYATNVGGQEFRWAPYLVSLVMADMKTSTKKKP